MSSKIRLPSNRYDLRIDGEYCQVAGVSHVGNFRQNNEDYILAERLGDTEGSSYGLLAMVCDGVGGGVCGDFASKLSANSFRDTLVKQVKFLRGDSTEIEWYRVLETCCHAAHEALLEAIVDDPSLDGMASTLTAVWMYRENCVLAQVGDSRLYLLREGELRQISMDQSPVGQLRQKGAISEEEARNHPYKNVVSQVIGGSKKPLEPDCDIHNVNPGDLFLLCSDGLSDSLDDEAIQNVLINQPEFKVRRRVDSLLDKALNVGGRDNVSVIMIQFGESENRLVAFCRKIFNALFKW